MILFRILMGLFILVEVVNAKQAISVMDFKAYGVDENIAKQVTDAFSTGLVNLKTFNIMDRSQVSQILKEQSFQQSGACNDESCLVEVGQILGVDRMIFGSIGKLDNSYTLNIKLLDVETAEIIAQQNIIYEGSLSKFVQTRVKPILKVLFSVKPEKVVANDSLINIKVGEKIKLNYSFFPEKSNDNISLEFTNKKILKFLPPDTVLAIGQGKSEAKIVLNSNRSIKSSLINFNVEKLKDGKNFWRASKITGIVISVVSAGALIAGLGENQKMEENITNYNDAQNKNDMYMFKSEAEQNERDRNRMYVISGILGAGALTLFIAF